MFINKHTHDSCHKNEKKKFFQQNFHLHIFKNRVTQPDYNLQIRDENVRRGPGRLTFPWACPLGLASSSKTLQMTVVVPTSSAATYRAAIDMLTALHNGGTHDRRRRQLDTHWTFFAFDSWRWRPRGVFGSWVGWRGAVGLMVGGLGLVFGLRGLEGLEGVWDFLVCVVLV